MKLSELNNLIVEFIELKPLKKNSRRAYETDLFFFSQFYVTEKFALAELNKTKLLNWLKQYSSRAAHRRGTNIRRFLLWLEEHKNINIHPEIRLPWQFTEEAPKKPDKPADLSEEEFKKLLTSPFIPLIRRVLIALLITIGPTLEELAVLQWSDFNLGKFAHITLGEAGKARVVPLEDNVTALLKELKNKNFNQDKFVFLTDRGEQPISSAYMALLIKRTTEKLLNRVISPTELQEYAKKRLLNKFSRFDVVLQMLGKKKASLLIKPTEKEINLEKLKQIHELAFKHH